MAFYRTEISAKSSMWMSVKFCTSESQLLCVLIQKLRNDTPLRWRGRLVFTKTCELPYRRFSGLKFEGF